MSRDIGTIVFFGFIFLHCTGCMQKDSMGANGNDEASQDNSSGGKPEIRFIADHHDFGDISPGETVSFTFTYINEGSANLIIRSCSAGCGCTVPKWSKEPLQPGKKGYIEIVFDSSGRKGAQLKNIMVRSNASEAVKTLTISANIIETE